MLEQPGVEVVDTQDLPERVRVDGCRDQRTWRLSPRAPY
jgi:hypothetical protein